jgi:hypothetical protein
LCSCKSAQWSFECRELLRYCNLLGVSREVLQQESLRQDYRLTTTYDLPGHRTLTPSSVSRRHVIAELDLSTITLSHALVPKLRPAAFLKARIKNTPYRKSMDPGCGSSTVAQRYQKICVFKSRTESLRQHFRIDIQNWNASKNRLVSKFATRI